MGGAGLSAGIHLDMFLVYPRAPLFFLVLLKRFLIDLCRLSVGDDFLKGRWPKDGSEDSEARR